MRSHRVGTGPHRAVDDDLYVDVLRHFGEKGLVDFAVLAGCYHLVCGLLNLFAIPAPSRRDNPSQEARNHA